MGGVRELGEFTRYVAALEGIGYEYVAQYEVYIPERRYFRKPRTGQGPRTDHLHIVELTSDFWGRRLLFRNYLRTNPVTLREYVDLKRRLATEYGDYGRGYTDAKGPFIESILGRAEGERAGYSFGPFLGGTSVRRFIV
jgi:GrpB-like predicted nucleotidyltransferase (UPF0157 family)